MRSFDFEFEIVSQIPDQMSEFYTIVKSMEKRYEHNFFPVKAETQYFSNLTLGGPRGDSH